MYILCLVPGRVEVLISATGRSSRFYALPQLPGIVLGSAPSVG